MYSIQDEIFNKNLAMVIVSFVLYAGQNKFMLEIAYAYTVNVFIKSFLTFFI
jgi:hypothetical protein